MSDPFSARFPGTCAACGERYPTDRRAATLPNCDCCGRFTARPTRIDTSWSGGAGMHVRSELLLCPHCATNCAKEMKEAP